MSGRRNPFETSETKPVTPPPSLLDSLRVASPRKRNRRWEKEHQHQKVVYRGVDPKLALRVKSIANSLLVPEGEVARAVIEHALHAYAIGDLNLNPRPNPYRIRLTLFPAAHTRRNYDPAARPRQRKKTDAVWRVIVTWRSFPLELKKELSVLASSEVLNVPVGELITVLLRFGFKEYDSGRLTLEPVQKTEAFTLAMKGTK